MRKDSPEEGEEGAVGTVAVERGRAVMETEKVREAMERRLLPSGWAGLKGSRSFS